MHRKCFLNDANLARLPDKQSWLERLVDDQGENQPASPDIRTMLALRVAGNTATSSLPGKQP